MGQHQSWLGADMLFTNLHTHSHTHQGVNVCAVSFLFFSLYWLVVDHSGGRESSRMSPSGCRGSPR